MARVRSDASGAAAGPGRGKEISLAAPACFVMSPACPFMVRRAYLICGVVWMLPGAERVGGDKNSNTNRRAFAIEGSPTASDRPLSREQMLSYRAPALAISTVTAMPDSRPAETAFVTWPPGVSSGWLASRHRLVSGAEATIPERRKQVVNCRQVPGRCVELRGHCICRAHCSQVNRPIRHRPPIEIPSVNFVVKQLEHVVVQWISQDCSVDATDAVGRAFNHLEEAAFVVQKDARDVLALVSAPCASKKMIDIRLRWQVNCRGHVSQ